LDEVYWGTHHTNTDTGLYNELNRLSFGEQDIKNFNQAVYHSGENSIDSFLEYRENKEFWEIGKISMAYILINKEPDSIHKFSVHSKNNDKFSVCDDNWYHYLYSSYLRTSFDDFDKNNFSVITFNYDRSFEEFLFTRLQSFGKSTLSCAEKLAQIDIIHLYDKLDDFPWETVEKSYKTRGYGTIALGDCLIKTSERIRIIPEDMDVENEESFRKAYKLINEAEKIIFLGLDLRNEKNLKRLGIKSYISSIEEPNSYQSGRFKIFGTSLNLKEGEKSRIRKYFNGRIYLELYESDIYDKSNCTNFLRENVILE
jgi:predicted DNA-binding antitoxin AbrB/MazE fold protein